jgi:CBS domain-containing protein
MALIRSVMNRNVISLEPTAMVRHVVELMRLHRLGSVLVVEQQQLVGIVTKWDLIDKVLSAHKDPEHTNLLSVYTRHPVTVQETTHVQECIQIIRTHNFRHLPVVDPAHRPVGIISTRDFLQFVTTELEQLIDRALQAQRPLPPRDLRFELSLRDALERMETKQDLHE